MTRLVPLHFAGREFGVTANGALFWPAREALLVADLHLEKASWYAMTGQMLPPYDSMATLELIAADLAATGASALYCLGDSFHDDQGGERLPDDALGLLTSLTARTDWVWITGNHDAGMVNRAGGKVRTEMLVDGLVLRHEAEAGDDRPELSGHFHPKLRVKAQGRLVSRRCFVASETKLILPAYGALTGGLDADHPEIRRAVGVGASALVPISDRLLKFPIAA